MYTSRSRLREDERGQSIVEFALTFLIVLTVVFAWSSSLAFCTKPYYPCGERRLRWAIVNSATASQGTVEPIVQQYAATSLHDTSSMTSPLPVRVSVVRLLTR